MRSSGFINNLKLFIAISAGLLLFLSISTLIEDLINAPLLIGSYGATTAILYTAPKMKFAKFSNVLYGHWISCAIGLLFNYFFAQCAIGLCFAIAASITLMYHMDYVHPPGGAITYIAYFYNFTNIYDSILFLIGTSILGPILFYQISKISLFAMKPQLKTTDNQHNH